MQISFEQTPYKGVCYIQKSFYTLIGCSDFLVNSYMECLNKSKAYTKLCVKHKVEEEIPPKRK